MGNCRVLGEIGSGGMAVVYRAIQEPLGRVVALKALKPSIALDSQFAERFEREARFMASLQHENILHVYDYVKENETNAIIMEYIEGIDLYDLLDMATRLPVDVAAIIALMVARALDYAHFRGIIHRDIKPANVMISNHGEVKLMDFGIARDESLSDLTETGTGLGTPSYMSPEQILGDKLDFRSDIFSLGIVLYQMITGNKPFVEDDSRTVMQKIRLDRYVPPRKINSDVPRQLERILARCMEKLPANRYPTTQALIDDLTEFLGSRVPINYNARVVLYFRDLGILSDQETDAILEAGDTRSLRRRPVDRKLLRHTAIAQGIVFAGVLLGGGAIQAAHGRFNAEGDTYRTTAPNAAVDDRAGYLSVVAEPWAHVYVDGQKLLTTPTAQRLPLSPGRHYLRFTNPFYRDVRREVRIWSGETETVRVRLEPRAAIGDALSGAVEGAEEIPTSPAPSDELDPLNEPDESEELPAP